MISTPMCCTSDYYSGSDDDVVKAAPQHHCSTNIILQTLLQFNHQQTPPSTTIQLEQSMRLLKLVRKNNLSDEVFIRSNGILHKYLLSTCTNEIDESILVACLSLATKLCEHSNHLTMTLFSSDILMMNENMICNALDWNIDIITPINYVEATLSCVMDYSLKARLRVLNYQLIVLCLTDARCGDLSAASVGICCLSIACELINCCEIIPQQVLEYKQNDVFETSLIKIRQVLIDILRR